jgi:hypothetical protein
MDLKIIALWGLTIMITLMLWCFFKNSIVERDGIIFKYLTKIENNDHFMVWHVFLHTSHSSTVNIKLTVIKILFSNIIRLLPYSYVVTSQLVITMFFF